MAPGLDVGRVDAHSWAISARGFNDVFANKLLVLIDGRSVYTPLFSGVYWDVQDVLLEDIERIEVIRGPGASLWGANAVNGVINVITKKAAATQGFLATGGGGNEERGFTGFRFGGALGDALHYRVYGKYFDRADSALPAGGQADDGWSSERAGFRVDWEPPGAHRLTLQGDSYEGREDELIQRLRPASPFVPYLDRDTPTFSGGNVLGRWTCNFGGGSELALQSYYDRTTRSSATLDEQRTTFDVDFQHRFDWGTRQTIVWGGGYRRTADKIGSTFDVTLTPAERTDELVSAFLQDEIALVKKKLTLTLGSKFEHNDYTGFEFQPSARLAWTPGERQTVWASVSRAVRTPSRAEDDIRLRSAPVLPPGALFAGLPPLVPPSPAVVTAIMGDRDFQSEELTAYEAGYRVKAGARLTADLALFYNDYDQLRSITPSDPALDFTASPAQFNLTGGNLMTGRTYGGELSVNLQLTDWWRIRADYALLKMDLRLAGASVPGFDARARPRKAARRISSRSARGSICRMASSSTRPCATWMRSPRCMCPPTSPSICASAGVRAGNSKFPWACRIS